MAALMKVTVEKVDGSKDTYPILPVTQVAFERQFKCGLGSLASDARMEYLYWLAWDAEKRAGKVVKPFDGWLDDLVSVEEEEEAAPLGSPSPTGSPGSP